MSTRLRVDPRKVKAFDDLRLPSVVLQRLRSRFAGPLPIQTKMLALNGSGVSVFARSLPNTGKTTAAIVGLLSTPRVPSSHITNLVLVPTPTLADHYREQMEKLGGRSEHCGVLYRTGSVAEDEAQHSHLLSCLRASTVTSLVATPQRVLDYISARPALLPLTKLRQVAVDELDVFGAKAPLETLLEHLLSVAQDSPPIMTLMATRVGEFERLPHIIQASGRPMFEAREDAPAWPGELITHRHMGVKTVELCATSVRHAWRGAGLVVPPPSLSSLKLQEQLRGLDGAVVLQPMEVAGLSIDNLENIYVLHPEQHSEADVERLKWSLTGGAKRLHLLSPH